MIDPASRRERMRRRLDRQFDALGRAVPLSRGLIRAFMTGWLRIVRLPAGLILVLGGLLSFLPVLGLWMLPLGLMLIAVDLPPLRPPVSAGVIRSRRRVATLYRRARLARRRKRR